MKNQIQKNLFSGKVLVLAVLLLLFSINLSFSQSGWYLVNTGVDSNYSWDWTSFINSNTGYVVGSEVIGGIFFPRIIKTTNGGVNWYQKTTLLKDSANFYFRYVLFTNSNTGFITAAQIVNSTVNGKILKTTNGGENWYNIPLPVNKHISMLFFINASTGYASGHQTILKTTDAGESWTTVVDWGSGFLFAIHFPNSNTGCVVGNFGNIYRTTDGGNNWTSLVHTSLNLWGLWFINSNVGFAVGGNNTNTPNIILKTTNGGANWDSVPHAYPTGMPWSVRFTSPDTGYITGVYRVLKTINGGLNWYSLSLPVDTNYLTIRNCYFTNANTGYLAGNNFTRTYGYIFKTTTAGEPTSIKYITSEVPDNFKLYQNYPNPFNPVTNIKWQMSKEGNAKLTLFDILGREVKILVNERLKTGTYEVSFDAGSLSSGVYFYKLSAGDFTDTKKMMLIK